jgi:hypothetical protein
MNDQLSPHLLEIYREEFAKYKVYGEKTIQRLNTAELHQSPDAATTNSIAVIIKHLSGNMVSRWTDFLTTDGEKPDRSRDSEFEDGHETKEQLIALWERGWKVLFDSFDSLEAGDVLKTVYIRKEPHTVIKAILRQVTHCSYHVGQIIFLAKQIKGSAWESLSIPKGKSEEYKKQMAANN